jgi:hypothetical protein
VGRGSRRIASERRDAFDGDDEP